LDSALKFLSNIKVFVRVVKEKMDSTERRKKENVRRKRKPAKEKTKTISPSSEFKGAILAKVKCSGRCHAEHSEAFDRKGKPDSSVVPPESDSFRMTKERHRRCTSIFF
jgi:hypothetical protein